MADLARLSLNTVTVRDRWSLAQCIEGCARHGIRWIEPWREKIAEYGLANTVRHLRDAGLSVSGVCRGGLFTAGDPRAAIEENRRAIDETAALGANGLVIVGGGLPEGSKDLPATRRIVADALAGLTPYARAAGVALVLEPLHPMTCADRCVVSTIAQALALAGSLGDDISIALDVYHIWWDPALEASIADAAGHIGAFHVCDWLVPTRDTVFDRGMMGDGIIDIPHIRALVEKAGYTGPIGVEILSRDWWQRDPDEVLRIAKERFASSV
jgi:sugar phosphate isomerase/epimerase